MKIKINYKEFFEYHVNGLTWRGAQGLGLCPFHDDHNPSLGVNYEFGGWNCFSGCGYGDFYSFVQKLYSELTTKKAVTNFLITNDYSEERKDIEKIYDYTDVDSNIIFQVVRYKKTNKHGKSGFSQRRPGSDGDWIYDLKGITTVPYNLPEVVSNKTIFIVEGEKDCETLKSLDITATCNPMGAGRDKWRKSYNQYFQDKEIIIIPDNDDVGRSHGIEIANNLVVDNRVKVIELPGLGHKEDVTDWVVKESETNDKEAVRHKLLKIILEAEEWKGSEERDIEEVICNLSHFFDGIVFIPKYLGDYILSKCHVITTSKSAYIYNDGVFKEDKSIFLETMCVKLLGHETRIKRVNETLRYISVITHAELEALNKDKHIVNLNNCMFDLKERKALPHSPDFLSTIRIPIDYDPDAECPEIEQFIGTTISKETVPLIEEIFGYLLFIDSVKLQKAFIFTGSGANGKSVMIDLMTRFIGDENTSKVSLQELAEHRFKRAEIHGKLLNIFADLSKEEIKNSAYFKILVTGDQMTAELKFKNPFNLKSNAKLVFSANEVPYSIDKTDAYYRRLIIIPFKSIFEGDSADNNLLDKLTTKEELSGLFNLALKGYARLQEKEGFSESGETKEELENYRKENDSVFAFVMERCTIDADERIDRISLFEAYERYCEEQGYFKVKRPTFYNRLIGYKGFRLKKIKIRGYDYIKGINVKNICDEDAGFYHELSS